jgi:type II restriction/modification system DNA methylase subunit YeeA
MIQIPIPELNFIHKQQIESIVNRILTAKRADPAANVSALEAEIDRLVYQRYGLTEEEIALVEARGIPGMGGGGVD